MLSIAQWNMNGYFNNNHELNLLINELSPDIICLQETHIKPGLKNPLVPIKYNSYFYNLPNITNAKQGIAILIKKNIEHSVIQINSNLSILAIRIKSIYSLTIINLYIPPFQQFSTSDLYQILSQVSNPLIIVGDFNSWSPLWGSPVVNNRGKEIENFIIPANLMVLNDGSPTHFSTHKSFTHVDLTISSSTISSKCQWNCLSSLYGSDHFPIITKIKFNNNRNIFKPKPKFKLELANWKKFSLFAENFLSRKPSSININKETAQIQKALVSAAHHSIPQTKCKILKHLVPWWNPELSVLRKIKQDCWYDFKKHNTTEFLIKYKKANALFRKKQNDSQWNHSQKL